ncbi:TPR domain protein [Xylaria castorea]|nr:TPR domain protein [Xylaria castorea]
MEIPGDDQISSMLRQTIAAAERANLKRGYIPKDQPHPQAVINKFMKHRFSTQLAYSGAEYPLTTTQVPPSYVPCVRRVDDLVPMMVSQMELQNHHRGRKATLRVLTPQDTMNAIMAVVEDEEGTALLLQLYHQPKPMAADPEDMLRPNMVLIVKEPYFKSATDGAYSIRVDHKDQPSKGEASAVIREQGNVAVKNKQWATAEELYSDAVRAAKTPEEKQLAYLNRSFVNLRLHRPEKALEDASIATETGQPNEKGSFREARALYELGKFPESFEKWRTVIELYPRNEDARMEFQRAEKRTKEAQTGKYDFGFMYKQAEATPPKIDCATYEGPVAIREAKCGNGLFTTKPVKAGDLLLCEKAFEYCYADKDDPIGRRNMSLLLQLDTKRGKVGGQAQLLTQIVQKLYHSPHALEDFKTLHHGDYTSVTVSEVDGHPVVDTFFVDRVISLNAFGAPRTSDGKRLFAENDMKEPSYTTCGVWLLASRINHACLGNCRRSFIGDMQIVRACRDLAAGTELRFAYQSSPPKTTYEETQKTVGNWGFICDCAWCLDRKSTAKKTLSTRNNLLGNLEAALMKVTSSAPIDPMLLSKISRLLANMKKTYPTRQGVVCPELWDGYFTLGSALISLGRPSDGMEAIIKGLEALGYEIVASPPRGDGKRFEIRRWGHLENSSMLAFLQLHEVYKVIAPELCPEVKRYAKIIYSICTGTDATIGTVFPPLA